MNRVLTFARLAPRVRPKFALTMLVASAVALNLVACTRNPTAVPLAELAARQERYDGEHVITSGVVRAFRDRPGAEVYYVLEDEAANRVAVSPGAAVRDRVGTPVTVEGTFVFDETRGRVLGDAKVVPERDPAQG